MIVSGIFIFIYLVKGMVKNTMNIKCNLRCIAFLLTMSLLGGCGGGGSSAAETTAAPATTAATEAATTTAESTVEAATTAASLSETVSKPEQKTPSIDDYLLTAAFPYSESGIAWVQYVSDKTSDTVTSAVDVSGDIIFSLPAGVIPDYLSSFKDTPDLENAYSYYRVGKNYEEKNAYEVIVDADGRECYRTHNSKDTKGWEHIIGHANNAFFCYIKRTGLENTSYTLVAMQPDGTIINSYDFGDEDPLSLSDDAVYYGEGWYGLGNGYINFEKQMFKYRTSLGPSYAFLLGEFINGEIPARMSSHGIYIFDTNLEKVRSVDFDSEHDPYSEHRINMDENILIYEGRSGIHRSPKVTYYDWWGDQICTVVAYPELEKYFYSFKGDDDYTIMLIKGSDKNMYLTLIDRQGEVQFEPYDLGIGYSDLKDHTIAFYNGYLNDYLIVQDKNDNYVLMDLNGNIIHSITKDFSGCTITGIGEFDEQGYLTIKYQLDGERGEYFKYYDVFNAALAGKSVYKIGNQTSLRDESAGEASRPEAVQETWQEIQPEGKDYTFVRNFSIEGKWKSVGEYGFGQAQPGAIVIFDGTNANFFSPQDTYAVYQDGDEYKLDATSFMSTSTVTLTIKTIDADHIDLFYGDQITELERINE